MWIRHPDGSAEVGLYRISYDYDPKNAQGQARRAGSDQVRRGRGRISPGAATVIVQDAEREKQEEEKRAGKSLPPLHVDRWPESVAHPKALGRRFRANFSSIRSSIAREAAPRKMGIPRRSMPVRSC